MDIDYIDLAGALNRVGEASREVSSRLSLLSLAAREMQARSTSALPAWYHVQMHVRRMNQR